jgi:TatD DNase family protein
MHFICDPHCHLYFDGLIERAEDVVGRAEDAGIAPLVVPGLDEATNLQAQALAQRFESVYFAVGVHPAEAKEHVDTDIEGMLERFVGDPKLVAIGEIGLDAYRDRDALELQRPLLRRQLAFAQSHELPVILHNRDASKELIQELEPFGGLRGMFHCFNGARSVIRFAHEHGFFVSFAGNLTYPTAQNLHSQLPRVDENLLMLETDTPFMPPQALRGQNRLCEPADLVHTLDFAAGKLAKSADMLRIILSRNTRKLFHFRGKTYGA